MFKDNAGVVRFEDGKYWSTPAAVDTSTASEAERRALKLHWTDVARARIAADAPGLFSWSVAAVSQADYEKLRALQVNYMTTLRQIIDASEPTLSCSRSTPAIELRSSQQRGHVAHRAGPAGRSLGGV